MSLIDRLTAVAQAWAGATGRTLGALSSIVTNHGGFFDRVEAGGAGANTTTLEKFARYFADPASWPDGDVPDEAQAFAHVVGVSLTEAAPSPGKAGANSPAEIQRDAA